ncbi:von Willebrand factor A [Achromatium sp. WMS2]|nr:von Willebrand factor A [Achromatium sp. WMS2]
MTDSFPVQSPAEQRLRRWRLVLGGGAADGTSCSLGSEDLNMDAALAALYSRDDIGGGNRRGGLGGSAPNVARWLGDIRKYFPASVVQIMQQDAIDRLQLRQLLLEPELIETIQPDVKLVATLISLGKIIPDHTKATARLVVRKVVDELLQRLDEPMRSAVSGALNRAVRNRRPRLAEIDWQRTIRANLKHYQPEYKTVVAETLIGYGRKSRRSQRDIILCIDQSGSMAASVIYSSIFGAVMASLPTVTTHLVVFDTAVVDLTPQLEDPVDVLFGTQLGGGTDINQAVSYCQTLIRDPENTILVLISDLYEGGVANKLLRRAAELVQSGVSFITLLALSDEGRPAYDETLAAELARLGVPSFACTPDQFPGLMATAIRREDIGQWAAKEKIMTTRPVEKLMN